MRHDWIFDVLADLHRYADRNGLPGLRAKVEEALIVARLETEGDAEAPDGLLRFRSARRAH